MPKANSQINRRRILEGAAFSTVAALVVGPAVAANAVAANAVAANAVAATGDDAALINAEAEIARLLAWKDTEPYPDAIEDPYAALYERVYELEDFIIATPPATLAGAAVKLRRLLDSKEGMDANDREVESLIGVLALVHGITGAPTHPTRPTHTLDAAADEPVGT